MLRLRGASAISNSLCNRHRNNDHCLATGQVAARCRKGTRVMRAAPARLPRRTAHARAGGGAGRGLGRGRRRERGGGGAGRGEGPPAPGLAANLCRWPDLRPRDTAAGRSHPGWGRAKGPRREGLCLSLCQAQGLLRSKAAPGHQRTASFLFAWWVFSRRSPPRPPNSAPTKTTSMATLAFIFLKIQKT